MDHITFKEKLNNGILNEQLSVLYGDDVNILAIQKKRYEKAIDRFIQLFSDSTDIHVYSAPGRSEIGGNHTDHQNGCAFGAAVDLDMIAVVSFHEEGVIHLHSEGFGSDTVSLSELSVHEDEKGKTVALIRGIASYFKEHGTDIKGFDAYVTSNVLGGSGLSSSAAFETLVATIIDAYYNNSVTDVIDIAKIGKYAENVYFGKSSGLLDQMVCSVGGTVFMDFRDPDMPAVKKYDVDFKKLGYDLCITDTKGSHSDLTDEYIAISDEMKSIAGYFNAEVLREVDENEFYASLSDIHAKYSDRAVLRAMHFFDENRRAQKEAQAISKGDTEEFFRLFDSSSYSSAVFLENLYSVKDHEQQGIPLAVALGRKVLGDDAHLRVHGGGFAGTVQAFVPTDMTGEYVKCMNELFGENSCYVLRIRPTGGTEIK